LGISEEAFLLDCWQRGTCPYCGQSFSAGQRVGSGKKSEGGFCSLNCYAEYHKLSLVERHERRTRNAGDPDGRK
jgi:hypothetical protein